MLKCGGSECKVTDVKMIYYLLKSQLHRFNFFRGVKEMKKTIWSVSVLFVLRFLLAGQETPHYQARVGFAFGMGIPNEASTLSIDRTHTAVILQRERGDGERLKVEARL